MRWRVGVHDVALRRRLIRLIQQSSIRVECRQLHARLWLGFGFLRGRPTHDKSLGHNRSLGHNGDAALPFASTNIERKTGHANQNNWYIAIFNEPLPQQTVPDLCPDCSKVFPVLVFTGKKNVVNQSSMSDVSLVLIYRRDGLFVSDSHNFVL